MTSRKKKGITLSLVLFLLFSVYSVTAFAAESDSGKFAIDVDLNVPNSEAVYDTQVWLYHVAAAEVDETGNLHMEPMELFQDLEFDNLTEERTPILLVQVCERLQQPGSVPDAEMNLAPNGVQRPGADGMIHFHDLDAGVYLLVKWGSAEPVDLDMLPTLVYLPSYHHESDRWEHTATVVPKFDWQPDGPVHPEQPDNQTSAVPDTKLPQTGMVQWPIPVLVLAGLVCIVIGSRLYRRGK